jgi:hypothetical protein
MMRKLLSLNTTWKGDNLWLLIYLGRCRSKEITHILRTVSGILVLNMQTGLKITARMVGLLHLPLKADFMSCIIAKMTTC